MSSYSNSVVFVGRLWRGMFDVDKKRGYNCTDKRKREMKLCNIHVKGVQKFI